MIQSPKIDKQIMENVYLFVNSFLESQGCP